MQPVCAAWPTDLSMGRAQPLAKQACRGWQRALRRRLLHGASSSFWGVYTSAYLPVGLFGAHCARGRCSPSLLHAQLLAIASAIILWGPVKVWGFSSPVVLQHVCLPVPLGHGIVRGDWLGRAVLHWSVA